LSDPAGLTRAGKPQAGGRQRWNNAVTTWSATLPGLADVDIDFVGAGNLLERLNQPGNEGRRWFFFEQRALGSQWCEEQFRHAERIADDRYTPDRHLSLPLERTVDRLVLNDHYHRLLTDHIETVHNSVTSVRAAWRGWLDQFQAQTGDTVTVPTMAGSGQPWREFSGLIDRAADIAQSLHGQLALVDERHAPASTAGTGAASDCADLLSRFLTEVRGVVPAERTGQHATAALPESAGEPDDPTPQQVDPLARLRVLTDSAGPMARAVRAVELLRTFLSSDRSKAAECGAWLVLGGPGQGKTHLLLTAVRRVLDRGGVAVPVLGEQLLGADPITEITQALGLGALPHRTFLQALDAAGAASGTRSLLVVDALNDSDQPHLWRTQLPVLLSRIAEYEHVAVLVSCRTTMSDVVLPAPIDRLALPVTHHHGFAGREVEGLERYLHDVPHALPRTPLLHSSFGNPLFVKLYADTLRTHSGVSMAPIAVGATRHRSAVFQTFLDLRARSICQDLRLDQAGRPVHRAVQAVAAHMAESGRQVLLREEARAIVDAYAPHATTWPNTMLGQLISRGVLATDRYYRPGHEPGAGVAFPHQAFSDDLIVRTALQQHEPDLARLAEHSVLPTDSVLRHWLDTATPNLREAATVVLPELIGVELIDALAATAPPHDQTDRNSDVRRRRGLYQALVDTLPLRPATTVTDRTRDLFNEAIAEHGVGTTALDAILAVSTEPHHLFNAHSLHRNLLALDPAQRDATWGIYFYDAYSEVGPLHRLLRWAEQIPTPTRLLPRQAPPPSSWVARRAGTRAAPTNTTSEPDAETVELAATVLTWTLTSSHRFLRDRATKALIQLLLGFPDVLITLVDRFLGTDATQVADLYLFTRLMVVTEGVILRVGHAQPDSVTALAQRIRELVYDDPDSPAHASRSAQLCDAARGILTAAHRLGVVTDADLAVTSHPHHAPLVVRHCPNRTWRIAIPETYAPPTPAPRGRRCGHPWMAISPTSVVTRSATPSPSSACCHWIGPSPPPQHAGSAPPDSTTSAWAVSAPLCPRPCGKPSVPRTRSAVCSATTRSPAVS
jgi:hypothetical protein